ncbi:hypothetical protein SDC9_143182 [bioreactor metagenome]|uniref:Uncharacterized protein n=1 Tax=bioreactor metagenome TaxID=1076179 RepID=A0A645E374_9ZZZZ
MNLQPIRIFGASANGNNPLKGFARHFFHQYLRILQGEGDPFQDRSRKMFDRMIRVHPDKTAADFAVDMRRAFPDDIRGEQQTIRTGFDRIHTFK